MFRKVFTVSMLLALLAGALAGCKGATPAAPPTAAPQALILATTTSTQDSGLLDYLLPDFKAQYNVDVQVIAVGTGQAIALGQKGDADVLLVHARAKEDEFMAAGDGVRREDVMYNDFIIVGPAADPAGIRGMTSAQEAFATIAAAQATFISRGDESGTHTKEKSIWQKAGIEPSGDWYVSAGQGMGEVLTMASEQQGYTLSDRATYLAQRDNLELEILVEGDPVLFNPYGVIAVNPAKSPRINAELCNTFIDWLISVPTQEKIGQFGVEEFGQPLFTPDSTPWNEAHPSGASGAALQITGKVATPLSLTMEDLQGMEIVEVTSAPPGKEERTYQGVRLNALLEMAGVQSDATTLTMSASDGFTADVPLADVQACADCLVAFDDDGSLRLCMPGMEGKAWVKTVISIEVK